jgi:hypothetical protein
MSEGLRQEIARLEARAATLGNARAHERAAGISQAARAILGPGRSREVPDRRRLRRRASRRLVDSMADGVAVVDEAGAPAQNPRRTDARPAPRIAPGAASHPRR